MMPHEWKSMAVWKCRKNTLKMVSENVKYTWFSSQRCPSFSFLSHAEDAYVSSRASRFHTCPPVSRWWRQHTEKHSDVPAKARKRKSNQYNINRNTSGIVLKDAQVHIIWCCINYTWLACENTHVCIFRVCVPQCCTQYTYRITTQLHSG